MILLDAITCLRDENGDPYAEAQCEDCGGEGVAMYPELWPTGHAEVWRTCEECKGDGSVEVNVVEPNSPWEDFYEVME